jgi:hypothetical protein
MIRKRDAGKPHVRLSACIALVLLLLVPTAAGAAPVRTIGLTAQIESVDGEIGTFCGAGPGDTITGSYTYTLDVRDSNPAKNVGDYNYSAPPYGITLDFGNEVVVRTDPNNTTFLIEIVDDFPAGDPPGSVPTDNYLLRSYFNESNCHPVEHIAWQLDDPTGTALESASLPPKAPNLADWQSIFGLTVEGRSGPFGFYVVRAHVTSVTTIK